MQMRVTIKDPSWPMTRDELKADSNEEEAKRVQEVLSRLKAEGIIPGDKYDEQAFLDYRELVKENFFVFWTAIYPPMERLLYALSYIIKPRNVLGLGIFTGNPVTWSLGPAIQGIYTAEKLVAVEIDENNARLCSDNFREICAGRAASVSVLAEDGFEVLKRYKPGEIDLLYLDANGVDPETGESSKRINYSFVKRGYDCIKPGGHVMCHNATMPSFLKEAGDYLDFTADDARFEKTAAIEIDEMGLEVSKKIST